jgi:hypothetical protein
MGLGGTRQGLWFYFHLCLTLAPVFSCRGEPVPTLPGSAWPWESKALLQATDALKMGGVHNPVTPASVLKRTVEWV